MVVVYVEDLGTGYSRMWTVTGDGWICDSEKLWEIIEDALYKDHNFLVEDVANVKRIKTNKKWLRKMLRKCKSMSEPLI